MDTQQKNLGELIACIIQPDENVSGTVLLPDGKVVSKVVDVSNDNFKTIVEAIKAGDKETAVKYLLGWSELCDYQDEENDLVIKNGVVKYNGYEINNALTKRLISMLKEGFDIKPLENFLKNLMENPSKTAVNELYSFLEKNSLGITHDGYFLAYKAVRNDYKSYHDGRTDNSIGSTPSMPRNMVNEDRNQTCSDGLHFASLEYAKSFGSDKIVALKINPRDVVSIPVDYNNQKGRACKYKVIAEVTNEVRKDNRDPLSESPVVFTVDFSDDQDFLEALMFEEVLMDYVDDCPQDNMSWDDTLSLSKNLKQKRDSKGRFVK